MKKLFVVCLVLLSLFFITVNSAGEIPKSEARSYIGQNVAVVLNCYASPYIIYGMPIDVIFYREEWYLVLKTYYYKPAEEFINLKNIQSIRIRYNYE